VTALAWILLGELLLVAFATTLLTTLAQRRRRHKTLAALDELLGRVTRGEAQRLQALERHAGGLPAPIGDPAALAARWLAEEKDFLRTLLPIFLNDDLGILAHLDEPLRRLLDERLPPLAADTEGDATSPTILSPVARKDFAEADAAMAIAALKTLDAGIGDAAEPLASASLANPLPPMPEESPPAAIVIPEAPPPAPVESAAGPAIDPGEAEFWAEMNTLLERPSSTGAAEPEATRMAESPTASQEELRLEEKLWAELGISADEAPLRKQVDEVVPAASATLESKDHDEIAGTPAPEENPEAIDLEVWDELKRLARMESMTEERPAVAPKESSAPSAEQQDQPRAPDEAAQE
jgi:hypothetical protein